MDRLNTPKQAMILAAGRGKRLGALSLRNPKPLLKVEHRTLIEYHLSKLASAGYKRIIINVSYMGQKIIDYLGDGSRFGLHIIYSIENPEPYGTGGGILNALHHFNHQPFLLLSADIWSDIDYSDIRLPKGSLAHCVLVPNPDYNPRGDMTLGADNIVESIVGNTQTYANISVLHPDFFNQCNKKSFALSIPLFAAIKQRKVSGQLFNGQWFNVGTANEIKRLKKHLRELKKKESV